MFDMLELMSRLTAAAFTGMTASVWADVKGDQVAIFDPHGTRTYRQLNANANRIVRFLRGQGLGEGDAVALLCSNRAEFTEVLSACLRGGFRVTPVNWHLNADEVAYIVEDCEAKALFADTRFPSSQTAVSPHLKVRVSIGADAPGFVPLAEILANEDSSDIDDPVMGGAMLYTSGTTGRPKGVYRRAATTVLAPGPGAGDDVQLCAGPAYHAAPLAFDIRAALAQGSPLVFLDKWDSEGVLAAIERHRVTRCHMVPIMFQRLLALPDEVKARYDISSLRYVIHGAAPCPPEVKRAMIDWLGPILHEYYAGSEGGAGFLVSSEEWLTRPGTVGRLPAPEALKILDEEGGEIAEPGRPGTLYFQVSPISPFEYFKDPAKTAAAHRDGYFTLGDVGYLDDDGYLFLTGRTAECIISGGVNIYPQEIEDVLLAHPKVLDVAVFGVPNSEMGEEVKAVVQPVPGVEPPPGEALAAELQAWCEGRLAHYKWPRSIDFDPQLPRLDNGKLYKTALRERYWEGRATRVV